jgi:hypothetical protein
MFGEALALFRQALAPDPNYALAMVGGAFVHVSNISSGWSESPEREAEAARELNSRAPAVITKVRSWAGR